MFNKFSSSHNSEFNAEPQRDIKCRFCKNKMIQFDGGLTVFVCTRCGGNCLINMKEKTHWFESGQGYVYKFPTSIVWSKTKVSLKK